MAYFKKMNNNPRYSALEKIPSRKSELKIQETKSSEIFGELVFTKETMLQYLPENIVEMIHSPESGPIKRETANLVANAMKTWAMSKGATHYTHWFQPLTGLTAEKHDSFFDLENGKPIEKFSGSNLVQQEPDASSFPSGGIRSTFEARGYTAWDVTSPAFIVGTTLCIPSLFISYTGETLDYKTPLLRTIHAIDKAATQVCQLLDKSIESVNVTLGPEQEYFLVDEALYYARPDLIMTGRTLIGAAPARGQQLEDHYFGTIPNRVMNFMMEVEKECLKLGIPIRTRHNEVAPGQYECAPLFESLNIANDHNLLMMDIMEKVAKKHHLKVLFHEKPFAGVNGSGKHNNWSLGTNTGKNLLSPGRTQRDNLMFLIFLINTIKAIHKNADLLRSSIASASNDHRLGANEAPPAIISVFLGSHLDYILNQLGNASLDNIEFVFKSEIKLGIQKIPEIMKDNTDRNRTSPFAFTGNKFEFRAVGASANCAVGMIILNTIVANQLNAFYEEVCKLTDNGTQKEVAILTILKRYVTESKNIRFEGNNYSEEWKQEAAKRGLNNITKTPKALYAIISKNSIEEFTKLGILTEHELHARFEIRTETYIKKIQIESKVLEELIHQYVLPAAFNYQKLIAETVENLIDIGFHKDEYQVQFELLKEITFHTNEIHKNLKFMKSEWENAGKIENLGEKASYIAENITPYFDIIRKHSDTLEGIIPDDLWKLPKYRELLFIK